MSSVLISCGAADEVFVMGDLGLEIDIATLISRINAAPRDELDIREEQTATLLEVAQRNYSDPRVTVSKERMEEPVLLLVLTVHGERQHWIVDGTHRLRARQMAGKSATRFVAVSRAMVRDLVRSR